MTHPALFTVEQSRTLRGTIPGGHTKNLFLKDKKGTPVPGHRARGCRRSSSSRCIGCSGRAAASPSAPPTSCARRWGSSPGRSRRSPRSTTPSGACSVVLDAAMMEHANAQLSPAGQHHDHLDRPRGPRAVPGGDRPPAPDRRGGAFRRRPARRVRHFRRVETHHRWLERETISAQGRRERRVPEARVSSLQTPPLTPFNPPYSGFGAIEPDSTSDRQLKRPN